MFTSDLRRTPRAFTWGLLSTVLLLSACATGGKARGPHYAAESFDSTSTHTRSFNGTATQTCEAARRALLSQGYFVSQPGVEQVAGRKQFQPANEVHLDVEMRVVCVRDERRGSGSLAFATAVQDRYELKKASSSASVGVGAIGSVSLPFSAGNDAMIKIASQTVTDDEFYSRFFVLLDEYLYVPPALAPEPAAVTAPVGGAVSGPAFAPTVLPPTPAPPAPAPPPSTGISPAVNPVAAPVTPVAPVVPAPMAEPLAPVPRLVPAAEAPPLTPAAPTALPVEPLSPAAPAAPAEAEVPQPVPPSPSRG